MGLFDNIKKQVSQGVGEVVGGVSKATTNKSETFTFTSLPESVEEMKALPEASGDSPYKVAALTVCALCAYAANKDIGIEMLNFLKGPSPLSEYEKGFLRDRFMDNKYYIPFSYFEGSSPANNYKPSEPYKVTVSSNPYSFQNEGYAKLFIKSSGADSAREVVLRKKESTGQWFLWEQMLLPDIRKPQEQDPWA